MSDFEFKFKDDVLFGVATASTQIEGGCTTHTWYEWTKNNDKTKDQTNSLKANSHWDNFKEHIDLMSQMHLETYRLSLEWARIEPEKEVFDEVAINHYIEEIKYLKEKNIIPLVTLHHFSNPIWFEELGGFKKRKNNNYFIGFVRYVSSALKDLVDEWCTINEPNIYAVNCFLFGEWLNEEKSVVSTVKVLNNLARCHREAYRILHEDNKNAKVGIAEHYNYSFPKNKKNLFDKLAAHFYNHAFNDAETLSMAYGKITFPLGFFPFKRGKYFDYVGINYYFATPCHGFKRETIEGFPKNDLGWDITPFGFDECLKHLHQQFPNTDIYVTENGTADKNDAFRCQFIYDHLKVMAKHPYVKRYYHWTFMDNFEWKEGQSACFGLVEYHYDDETYQVRPSGEFYSEIVTSKGVTKEMMEKYHIKK